MNNYEMLCIAKLFSLAMGYSSVRPTKVELEVATDVIKKMVDNNLNLNQQQKEMYKFLVDVAKENTNTIG